MSAFTEEQQAVLREVLHHVWSRMGTVQDDQNEDSLRLASAIATDHGGDSGRRRHRVPSPAGRGRELR
jgi:hypothetical protein